MIILVFMLSIVTPQASPDPYAIYTKAMQHLATLPEPRYIIDTQRQIITTVRNGEVHDDTENVARYVYDTNTRLECGFFLPFNRTDQPTIGPSYFGPDTWLVRKGFHSPANATLTPDLSDLKTIASIIVVGRPSYDIRLVGIEPLTNEGSAYHLILRPRFDPVRHNLRELWVNTVTYNIARAVIEGVYRYDPNDLAEDTFVTEDFGSVGGYWLVIHKTWSYAKPFSPIKYEFNFSSMSMQFPPSVPPWLFDLRAFSAHTFNATGPLFTQ